MIAVLDNIRSGHNVGSIFRTADGLGFKKVYLCGVTPAPIDEFKQARSQITKVSLGAEKYVEWEWISNSYRVIDSLKKQGYKIFAVEQDKRSIPYFETRILEKDLEKIALVVGNEVDGLSKSILKRVEKILEIPMSGKKESLNVSVAFGIVAFYLKYSCY